MGDVERGASHGEVAKQCHVRGVRYRLGHGSRGRAAGSAADACTSSARSRTRRAIGEVAPHGSASSRA